MGVCISIYIYRAAGGGRRWPGGAGAGREGGGQRASGRSPEAIARRFFDFFRDVPRGLLCFEATSGQGTAGGGQGTAGGRPGDGRRVAGGTQVPILGGPQSARLGTFLARFWAGFPAHSLRARPAILDLSSYKLVICAKRCDNSQGRCVLLSRQLRGQFEKG